MDEWTFVKPKKICKKNCAKPKIKDIHNKLTSNDLSIKLFENQSENDIFDEIMLISESLFHSRLYSLLIKRLDTLNRNYNQFISIGIGSFSSSYTSRLQFSFAICLCRYYFKTVLTTSSHQDFECFPPCKAMVYDPAFTHSDINLCRRFNIEVPAENHRGRYISSENDFNTFFFMPHCPYGLYCNTLWCNWDRLDSIVLLGNRYDRHQLLIRFADERYH
jgi:hypothetical protein